MNNGASNNPLTKSTFRDVVTDGVCHQKRTRDQYNHLGAPPVELNLKKARVQRVSRNVATQIILKYEWLGTIPIVTTRTIEPSEA